MSDDKNYYDCYMNMIFKTKGELRKLYDEECWKSWDESIARTRALIAEAHKQDLIDAGKSDD